MSQSIHPVFAAFLAGLCTWGATAAGAAMVFFFKEIKPKILNLMLGFAAGIMIAASFWSLLLPALEASKKYKYSWIPVITGFGLGSLFLFIADKLLPHIHRLDGTVEGGTTKKTWKRSLLLVTAITMHNIPEGLSFGVAFGTAANTDVSSYTSAIALAVGMALQNFPEGAAVSIPLRREGMSRLKSFFYGQASGIVEPIAAVLGAWLASSIEVLLPYALSFAAGAMIFVVVEELIPESQTDSHLYGHMATCGTIIGFLLMTFLDITTG